MANIFITGCGLSLAPDYQFWGDLWEEGDCWIFYACGDERGLSDPLSPHAKILEVFTTSYFQRRNVFVIHKSLTTFNSAARAYILKDVT